MKELSFLNKMTKLVNDTHREMDEVTITRYACYLVAQNEYLIKS